MKNLFKLFLVNVFVMFGLTANSQCTVTATTSTNDVLCGQCADLNAIGIQGTLVMDNDFNGGGVGAGWSATSAADFTNPCGAGPGGTYMWMGSTSPAPRTLTTNGFDLSCGGQVCFDFRMAEQGGASPCEGPDLPTEGIDFQYSTDGGTTWNTINYFDPGTGFDPIMTTWNNYCFTLPAGAWSASTMFQWTQGATSSNLNDHWGIDNVQILANDCGYYYDWDHIPGSPDLASGGTVCPTSTTTYNVMYTNGINDTCYSSVTVNVLFPDVDVTATPPTVTTCGGCTTLDGSLSNIPPDSCCFSIDMQDSFGDGWNGGFLNVIVTGGPTLGPFSAVGNGSVATFCLADGATFTLDYTSGAWESENTYTLLDPSSVAIFNDGPTPTTGNVYVGTVNCGTPPPVYVWNWTGSGLTPINDSTQTACPTVSGWYYVDVSSGGCNTTDSVYVDYTATPVTSTTNIDLCTGSDYTFPDGTLQTNITVNTTQVSTLIGASVLGCDSVITTNINIVPTINISNNTTICSGDDYTFPDGSIQTNITAQVTQLSNFVTAGGCDSIITTTVDVFPLTTIVDNITICSGDDYTFPDGTVTTGIIAPMTNTTILTDINGCDSTITTNISVNPTFNIVENVSVCNGESYTFPDGTVQASVTAPTTYISNLTTILGCDSIITTNVSVNPVFNLSENVDICDGSDYTFPDGTVQVGISAPMTHISNLVSVDGCDSIITTNISILPVITNTINSSICDGSDYTFADGTVQTNITVPTTYVSTLVSSSGCDSLVTENITVNPTYNLVENFDQCPGLDFTFPDGTVQTNINSDVTHVSNLLTSNGCDSIITTNVNIFIVPPFDVSFSPNGCPPLDMTITNNTLGSNCNVSVSGPGWFNSYSTCTPISNTYLNSGLYDVTITMESLDGCVMDTTILGAFEVYPEPLAQFTWSPHEGTVITDEDIHFNNLSVGGDTYFWEFGDGATSDQYHISHTYVDSGYYNVNLTVTNDYGCSDTANGVVIINNLFLLYVPNTFTPDGDIHNNIFLPIISGHDPSRYTLLIFNRWGEVLFESHDSNVGWDGTYGGQLVQDGTYVWTIKAHSEGRNKEYIGHVNVLR